MFLNLIKGLNDDSTQKELLQITSSSAMYISSSSFSTTIQYGELLDQRDGKSYKTVKIGSQEWMAENLNFIYPIYNEPATKDHCDANRSNCVWTPHTCGITNSDTCAITKKYSSCLNDDPSNCTIYGRLYRWIAAIDGVGLFSNNIKCYGANCDIWGSIRGICPKGWHLPSKGEWGNLVDYVKKNPYHLQAKGYTQWPKAVDLYGFRAIPGGLTNMNVCSFWSSTPNYKLTGAASGFKVFSAYVFTIYEDEIKYDGIEGNELEIKRYVRCIKDEE